MSSTNRPSIFSTHDPLDIGRMTKVNKFAGIIDNNDIDYHKADTIKFAQNNRNHQSRRKYRIKKAKPSDIFFAQEIQAETERMLNIGSIVKIKRRQQAVASMTQNGFESPKPKLTRNLNNQSSLDGSPRLNISDSPLVRSPKSRIKQSNIFIDGKVP